MNLAIQCRSSLTLAVFSVDVDPPSIDLPVLTGFSGHCGSVVGHWEQVQVERPEI